MKKYPELHPKEKKYLENLFYSSNHFQEKIKELREKHVISISSEPGKKVDSLYTETINFFRANERLARETYSQDEYKKWKSFHDDTLKLATYFHIQKYFSYFKKYVLGRLFEPLSFQKLIRCDADNITIKVPYQISKSEFQDIWKEIESAKNSNIGKQAIKEGEVQQRYRKDIYFDDKFLYHKENKEGVLLSKHLEDKDIDESNKYAWIREIEEAKTLLVTKVES